MAVAEEVAVLAGGWKRTAVEESEELGARHVRLAEQLVELRAIELLGEVRFARVAHHRRRAAAARRAPGGAAAVALLSAQLELA